MEELHNGQTPEEDLPEEEAPAPEEEAPEEDLFDEASEFNEDEETAPPQKKLTAVQRFYENFRGVPIKYIDAVILLCILVLVFIFTKNLFVR